MSSFRSGSRIIKSGQGAPHAFQSFNFGHILDETPTQELPPGAAGFVHQALGSGPVGLGLPDPAATVAEVPEPAMPSLEGMIVLPEDEFQAKVDELYRNGMDEGRRQAERGLANVFKSLRDGVTALTGLRSRVLKESEEDLLKLAVMIARKIVQQEIAQEPAILASLIAAAVGGCTDRDRVVVRLNPDDYTVVAANRQTFLSSLGDDLPITLTPDEGVGPGGCLVETATGTIDARIESQLDEIYRTLLEERSAPAETPPAPPEAEPRPELPLVVEDAIPPFTGQGAWLKAEEEKPYVEE
ncbi:FliH/SctL family protein [Geobacter sp.]|uniref:FliH/SctL family protein n=1 Tax=Geobacter sp. TaxID=46610 RepID=UPI001ACD551B|nr:FliH/SctL family protein [Geobacter sp.]CAG0993056.1 Yop proteins translocation protein L [Geobacteraceae bacterium]